MSSSNKHTIFANPIPFQVHSPSSLPKINAFAPSMISLLQNANKQSDLNYVKAVTSSVFLNKNARSMSPEDITGPERRKRNVRRKKEAKRIKLLLEYKNLQEILKKNKNFDNKTSIVISNICFRIIDSLNEYLFKKFAFFINFHKIFK